MKKSCDVILLTFLGDVITVPSL